MNKIKVGFQYLDTEYELGPTDSDKQSFMIGANWKIAGPHSVQAGYTEADDTGGSNTTVTIGGGNGVIMPNAPGTSTGGKFYSVSYQYSFSKRTSARFGYAVVDNDSHANYSLGGLRNQSLGQKQEALVMFLQHNF